MASKKSNTMLKSGARMQPIRATQPFQLVQGNLARNSPSSSPTPRSATDPRVTVRNRRSSDHRSSPDRNDRKSPNSPSIKVSNRRSPSPSIRRTSSLDTVAGPYMTGQWPRDFAITTHQHTMRDKTTQTPDWSVENAFQQTLQIKSNSKSGRSSIADPDFKQMRKQLLRTIAKRSNDKKERSPPVHGNHSALQQFSTPQPRSNPISIGNQAFGRIPRRQNSVEALNKEIDMFISNNSAGTEPRIYQGITPPDGHRAPLPRSSTRTMETQTPQDMRIGVEITKEEVDNNSENVHSPLSSPGASEQQQQQQQTHTGSTVLRNVSEFDSKDSGISPCPKYASSPRPNKSYMFREREPPEGAENVKPFKEQDAPRSVLPSCPDVKKINFNKSISSAFTPLPSKPMQPFSAAMLNQDSSNNSTLHASMMNGFVPVNAGNSSSNVSQCASSNNNVLNGLSILMSAVTNTDL